MKRRSWEQILKKYSQSIGPGKEVIIGFKNARDHISDVIEEIDEDFSYSGEEGWKWDCSHCRIG